MRIKGFILCLLLVLGISMPGRADIPDRPEPQRLVNDYAGLFSEAQKAELERMLVEFDDSTSNQLTVVTVSDLEGYDVGDYAVRLGLKWGVGSKDFNNGIVVLVKPKDEDSRGRVSIKVGYGLEGILPDITCSRIIENDMIPHFRDNDYYGGVRDACITLMKYAKGEISVKRDRSHEEDLITLMLKLLVFMFILYIIVRVIGKSSNDDGHFGSGSGGRRVIIGPMGGWGGSSRGSSWGGGGFGGGGFGGFGGGSFGGGGASGSW